jgi:predicted nucleic acid-binding protein
MLDTNVFNRALDGDLDPVYLTHRGLLYATHVQLNELQATKRPEKLRQLLQVFHTVDQEILPTAAAVFGVSEWGGAEYGDANDCYAGMLQRLNQINGGKKNNMQDALIAATAMQRKLILVTDDKDLTTVLKEFGGCAESFDEFVA